jgi:hypothetical protein
MDLAGSEPRAPPFATRGDLPVASSSKSDNGSTCSEDIYGLGGIRTRGLYVANVTIYP